MKILLTVASVLLLVFALQTAGVEAATSSEPSNTGTLEQLDPATSLTGDNFGLPSPMLPILSQLHPSECSLIEGTYCEASGPAGRPRCYDSAYCEWFWCSCVSNAFVCYN